MQPYEVICAPYTCYLGPIGATPPGLGTQLFPTPPPSPWTTVGTSGSKSYMDVGVTVTHSQTLGTFVPGGSTAIRKAWRQTEELVVAFSIADMSLPQYALQLNNAAVLTTAATTGTPGDQHLEVYRGVLVTSFAMVIRGVSPFQEAYVAQYEIPATYNAGSAAPVFSKQGPAVLAVEWHAYELNVGQLATFRAANTPSATP